MNQDTAHELPFTDGAQSFIRVVFLRKKVVMLTVLAIMVSVYAALQLKTPLYEARVTMLIQARKHIASPYYEGIQDSGTLALTATQSEIVKSNPVIERVVRRLKLTGAAHGYQRQFATPLKLFMLDLANRISAVVPRSSTAEDSEAIRFREAVEDLKARISVIPVRDTNLFTIAVTDYSPAMAVRIANMVSRSYSIFDLEQQLSEMKQKYGEKHLFVKQIQDNIAAIEKEAPAEGISPVEAIGPASVKVIEQATAPISPQGASGAVTMAVAFILSIIAGCAAAFFAEAHDQTFRAPSDIVSFPGAVMLGYIPRRQSPIAQLLGGFRTVLRAVVLLTAVCVLIEWLAAWAGVSQENQFLGAARYLTDRMVELSVNRPASALTAIGYYAILLFIMACGMGLVFLASWEIRRAQHSVSVLRNAHKDSLAAQSYSEVSDEVCRVIGASQNKAAVIAHASASGDSRALIVNLGISLSQRKGFKVLLIDARLDAPSLHRIFGVSNEQGFSELSRLETSNPILSREVSAGLFLLPAGQLRQSPETLLRAPSTGALLKKAQREYDIVLVHAAIGDAGLLAPQTAGVVLVVDEHQTRRKTAAIQFEALKKKGAGILGVILQNRVFVIPGLIYDRI